MSDHRIILAQLDALDESAAAFQWRDGETVDRVRVEIPRHEWELAGRLAVVTVVLADLTGARIDDADALADAWSDGYKHGGADGQRDDEMRAANPHYGRAR